MRRRALLGAMGTSATAGRIGSILGFSSKRPRFTIEPDSIPDWLPAALDTNLVREVTETHPTKIRVAFECTADDARTFRFGYPCPFADTVGVGKTGRDSSSSTKPVPPIEIVAAGKPKRSTDEV
ncbi:hypothetical protein [Haladaptatus sp. DFWS20]|uniref:hypothetical protein n=1 Tax=Haladaptatus sp. DFWS20 TaxID=3403467 RepID=UPI003EC052A1